MRQIEQGFDLGKVFIGLAHDYSRCRTAAMLRFQIIIQTGQDFGADAVDQQSIVLGRTLGQSAYDSIQAAQRLERLGPRLLGQHRKEGLQIILQCHPGFRPVGSRLQLGGHGLPQALQRFLHHMHCRNRLFETPGQTLGINLTVS